jgi:hypothetical protein
VTLNLLPLIEDLAFGRRSREHIAQLYRMSLSELEDFAVQWSTTIDRCRWNRYMELKHLQLKGEVQDLLREIERDRELNRKIKAQKASGKAGIG